MLKTPCGRAERSRIDACFTPRATRLIRRGCGTYATGRHCERARCSTRRQRPSRPRPSGASRAFRNWVGQTNGRAAGEERGGEGKGEDALASYKKMVQAVQAKGHLSTC